MVKVTRNEFREGDLAVRTWRITFFGIPIFRARITSTNSVAIRQLTKINNNKLNIKGFTNEDQSKED